jgi:hypothetical protein
MDLITALRVLRRRWLLTSTLLLMSLAAVGAVTFKLPWTYQAQSTVVLLPSRSLSAVNGYNPYMSFGQSITNTAYLLSVAVTSPPYQQKFTAAGDTGTYTVLPAPNTDGPVLVTTVLAKSRAVAEQTLVAVTQALDSSLRQTQAAQGVPKKNLITLQVESMTTKPTRLVSKKAKTESIVVALALFITIGVPLLVDAQSRRRAQEQRQSLNDEHWRIDERAPLREQRQPNAHQRRQLSAEHRDQATRAEGRLARQHRE